MVKTKTSPSEDLQAAMLIWELDLESPSRQMMAATACAGCALLLASVALRSKSKPALPLPPDVAEETVLWIAELHGGREDILEFLADVGYGKCVEACAKTDACALLRLPPPNLRPPLSIWHAQTTAPWTLWTSASTTHSAVGHASRATIASEEARQVLSDDIDNEESGELEDGTTLLDTLLGPRQVAQGQRHTLAETRLRFTFLDGTMFLDSGVGNEVRYMF